MTSGDRFHRRLSGEGAPLLLDSAMGTELERRGASARLPLWSAWALLEAPETVLAIHRDDVAAGAEVLTANTFRTHRRSLGKEGLAERDRELTNRAVALARRASAAGQGEVFVAGSLSPLEDCYRPDLVPDDAALEAEHRAQADALAEAGVDLILAETHNSIRELAAAVRAAQRTGLPVVASMVTDGSGHLLSGERIEDAVREIDAVAPDALAINCVPAGRLEDELASIARAAPGRRLGAWGNLGPPSDADQTQFTAAVSPDEYAALASRWLGLGARLLGGCCGTSWTHTAALRRLLDAPQTMSIASPKE